MDFLSASGLEADFAFYPAVSGSEIYLPGPRGEGTLIESWFRFLFLETG